jgi:hypothetical protein
MVPVLMVLLVLGGLAAVGTTLLTRSSHPADPAAPLLRGAEPAPVRTGAATCTDPVDDQQWQVSWRATTDSSAGTTLQPTGFAVRSLHVTASASPTASATPGGTTTTTSGSSPGWRTADEARWALQWNPTRAEMLTSTQGKPHELVGSLSRLAAPELGAGDAPRYLTPDGSCSVFLSPFNPVPLSTSGPSSTPGPSSGASSPTGSVAVLGDSLVAQLYPPDDSSSSAGALARRLGASGHPSEIIGQDGQRWTMPPGGVPGLAQANLSLLDEMRGLRDASAMVIALGRHDAGWVALATDPSMFQRRLDWVTRRLAPVITELRAEGHCTVLVTTATRDKRYGGAAAARFQLAAGRINDDLRAGAAASPDDQLKISDWAALADRHTSVDPVPWFGASTVQLNEAGIVGYADELTSAAALC